MALVAQRIEQLRPKQLVGGSIPFEGTIICGFFLTILLRKMA
jgi:hypothetical protein